MGFCSLLQLLAATSWKTPNGFQGKIHMFVLNTPTPSSVQGHAQVPPPYPYPYHTYPHTTYENGIKPFHPFAFSFFFGGISQLGFVCVLTDLWFRWWQEPHLPRETRVLPDRGSARVECECLEQQHSHPGWLHWKHEVIVCFSLSYKSRGRAWK